MFLRNPHPDAHCKNCGNLKRIVSDPACSTLCEEIMHYGAKQIEGPNKMTPEQKKWIDESTLVELLSKWCSSESEDPMMQGEAGAYLQKRMFKMRDEDNDAWVRASKQVGWKRAL